MKCDQVGVTISAKVQIDPFFQLIARHSLLDDLGMVNHNLCISDW